MLCIDLLNRYTVNTRIGGSNPPLSATFLRNPRKITSFKAFNLRY